MITGVEDLQKNLKKIAEKYGKAKTQAAKKGAILVRNTAVKSIQEKSIGREVIRYTKGGNPKNHIAAAEGQAPNTDTGALVKSIQIEITPNGVFVGSGIEYAPALEFGTMTVGARPWLFPALEANKDKIMQAYKDELKKAGK